VFQVSPLAVVGSAFTFYFDFDPESPLESIVGMVAMLNAAWLVLAAGLVVAVLNMVFARFAKPRRARAKPEEAPRSWIARTLVSAN
jgi:hypothetical protein